VRNRRSARTGRRPRKFDRRSSTYPFTSADFGARPLRAARANRVFCTDEKRIRTENAVMDKRKGGSGLLLSKFDRRSSMYPSTSADFGTRDFQQPVRSPASR
jgi:hypothetical protein